MTSLLLAFALVAALHDDPEYLAAADRYRDLDYEQALLTFERLSVRADLAAEEKAEVLLWMALCYDGVGDASSADRMMREALTRARDAQLPVKASPNFVGRLEAIRAQLPAADRAANAQGSEPAVGDATSNAQANAPPTSSEAGPPLVPIALLGGAGLAVAGAAALGVVAAVQWGAANDGGRFVDERVQAHAVYTGSLVGAIALGVVGAGLGVGGAALWLTQSEP